MLTSTSDVLLLLIYAKWIYMLCISLKIGGKWVIGYSIGYSIYFQLCLL